MNSLIQVPNAGALARIVETPAFTREMLSLTHRLDVMVPPRPHGGHAPHETSGRIFQLLGIQGGEGTTTVVSELARVSAVELDRSTIVLNASQSAQLGPNERETLVSSLRQLAQTGERPTGGSLVEVPFDQARAYRTAIRRPEMELTFFRHLRAAFDITFLDSPAHHDRSESIGLSRLVDGVILVLDPDTERRAAAELKEEVEEVGGRILGILFNKQESHLPNWLGRLI